MLEKISIFWKGESVPHDMLSITRGNLAYFHDTSIKKRWLYDLNRLDPYTF